MHVKKFTISTEDVTVPSDRTPTVYRIDFSGPAPVDSVEIAYDHPEPHSVEVTFAVDGDYIARAGLYDQDDLLLGKVVEASFTSTATETKVVKGTSTLTVEEV